MKNATVSHLLSWFCWGELLVEYATYQMNSQLFVQKYQLYLPEKEELRQELERMLEEAENE